ncbi:MAG: formylglycine-generating enzyme family protein [Bacteroidales bacterium]|nr:formylglycine-generating enzyme family protein [Bacteroidales bacterium]
MRKTFLLLLSAWLLLLSACQKETSYTIVVRSANEQRGIVSGSGTYQKGDRITISATARSGYHFVQWDDQNTDNPRYIVVSHDATYTALFAEDSNDAGDTLAGFIHLQTNGRYTFMATSTNAAGGEEVAISTDYWIGKYAVTNAQWKEYIDATGVDAPRYWDGGNIPAGRENHPVLWVSCNQAEAYCAWRSQHTEGWTFRLPTSAEWEYAAAGDGRTDYAWGSSADNSYQNGTLTSKFNYNGVVAAEVLRTPDRMATYNNPNSTRYNESDRIGDILSISPTGGVSGWVDHTNYLGFIYTDIFTQINEAGGNTCAVDAYPEGVSWCGCYNMSGNCWEWTATVEVAQNGAEQGQNVNAIRGGSWYANATSCKTSFRGEGRRPTSAYNTVGFRLVAEKVE